MSTSDETSPGAARDLSPEQAPSYSLTLKGDGVEISRDVSQEIALQIIAIAMGGSPGVPAGPAAAPQRSGSMPQAGGQTIAIREFLNNCGAKSNPDKITAIAIYLRDHLGRDSVSRDDIKGWFRKAGEPAPANYSRDFSLALGAGWIAEDHGTSGEYYVTNSGLEALKAGFQTKPSASGRSRRKRSKASKAKGGTE